MKKLFTYAALMFALQTAEAATRLNGVTSEDKDASEKLRGHLDFEKEEVIREPELEAFLKENNSVFAKVVQANLYAVPQLCAYEFPAQVAKEKKS